MLLISKAKFVQIMNKLEESVRFSEEIATTCNKYASWSNGFDSDYLLGETVELLEMLVYKGDVPEFSLIDYFVYELDFGKNYKVGSVKHDGENIDISSPDILYDYLESLF